MLVGDDLSAYVFGSAEPDFVVTVSPPPPLPIPIQRERSAIRRELDEYGWTHLYAPLGEPERQLTIYIRDLDPEEAVSPVGGGRRGESQFVMQRGFIAAELYEERGFLRRPRRGDIIYGEEEAWYVEDVNVQRRASYALRYILTLSGHQAWPLR